MVSGPGPLHVINNFLEAWFYIEIKIAAGLVIDGNHFTGPQGNSLVLTVRNQGGKAPRSVIRDVRVTNNLFDHTGYITLQLLDNEKTATEGVKVLVANNLWTDFAGYWVQTGAGRDITIAHNTVRNLLGPSGSILFCGMNGARGLVVRDNIVNYNLYGYNGDAGRCWPGLVTTHNVIVDDQSVGGLSARFPKDYVVASDRAVGFTNLAAAGHDYHGYALAPGSRYKNAASDATDVGVHMGGLDAAQARGSSP